MAVTTTQNPRLSGARLSSSDPAVDADAFAATTAYTLSTVARGLWINTAGDVYVDFYGGIEGRTVSTNIKFTVAANTLLPIAVIAIRVASTASGVVLY